MRSRMKVSILTVCEPHITTPLYLVCEEHYEEKCVKMPKKVAIKVKLRVGGAGALKNLHHLSGS